MGLSTARCISVVHRCLQPIEALWNVKANVLITHKPTHLNSAGECYFSVFPTVSQNKHYRKDAVLCRTTSLLGNEWKKNRREKLETRKEMMRNALVKFSPGKENEIKQEKNKFPKCLGWCSKRGQNVYLLHRERWTLFKIIEGRKDSKASTGFILNVLHCW